jgi:hypothetical protein
MPSPRHVQLLVVHADPLAELASGEQDTRLSLAQILVGWKPSTPKSTWRPICYPILRATRSPQCWMTRSCWSLAVPPLPEMDPWTRSVARTVLNRATCQVAVIPHQHPRSATAD